MRWSLSRLRPLHIALLSVTYWVGLAVVKVGSAILTAWEISRLPPGHASITAGLQNTVLHLTMVQDGIPVWTGSVSVGTLVALVVGPPLLLTLTWRWTREVEAAGGPDPALAASGEPGGSAPLLPEPAQRWKPGRAPDSATTRVVDVRRPDASDPRTPPSGRPR